MEIKKYLDNFVILFNQQKILFIITGVILIMIISLAGMSLLGGSSTQKTIPTSPTANIPSNQTNPNSSPSDIGSSTPPPSNAPLTTKFIYFIGGIFNPTKKSSSTSNQATNSPNRNYQKSTLTPAPTSPISSVGSVTNTTGSSGKGSSSSTNNGGQQSSTGQNNSVIATPTPITEINIVFKQENGEYWTYVPPAVPPIDTQWVKYTNYQDHYSIEYPSGWIVAKSSYNGHEGITIYMPGDSGTIDKPSIAFVGWKADYLNQSASYTGQIFLNGTPGTIYTNGPFGISSIAAVFQYQLGYFALGSSASNDIFLYVFDHMLRSLDFNI